MTDVVRNELFPTADMIVSMSREFGVPFTQKDFEGKLFHRIYKIYSFRLNMT